MSWADYNVFIIGDLKMIVTTVAALGEAETDFNVAMFHLSLMAEGETAQLANSNLKTQVVELNNTLSKINSDVKAHEVRNSRISSTSVQPHYVYDDEKRKNERRGFRASYSLSFKVDSMDKVSQVYDELTKLSSDKLSINSPTFGLKSSEKLNKKALKDAWKKVKNRFSEECKIMGLSDSDYEVSNWEVSYNDSRRTGARPMMAMSLSAREESIGGGAAPIEIHSGKAKICVNLNVSFQRKPV